MVSKYKYQVSVFLVWLFNISGILGILSQYSDWFLALTPLNLILYLIVIVWNLKEWNQNFVVAFFVPFIFGFVTEYLGVNYGLIFGNYSYGENLGFKVGGVPLMICVNWAVLVIITSDLSSFISKNIWIRAFLVGLSMTLLDAIIEVSAPRFDFWEFENSIVPFQNYLGWFVISFAAYLVYQLFPIKTNRNLSIHLLIAIGVFFLTFLMF